MAEIAALFLAGLSLFFTGIAGLTARLQQLSSRKFRQLLVALTDAPLRATLVGAAFGALTQSATAVAFIAAGMVTTRVLSLRRALPVVAAANIGTALLVFLAAVDLRLAELYLIGVTGLMLSFRVAARHEVLVGALFSTGLLFFGLDLMKRAFVDLPSYEWFHALVDFIRDWPLAPFLIGMACRMIVQSTSAIGVIAIALAHAGLFTDEQSILMIFGAGPGAALSALFLSAGLHGAARQILLFQGMINAAGGCGLAVLVGIDALGGHPFLPPMRPLIGGEGSADVLALAYLALMLATLVTGVALLPIAERLLAWLAPATAEQDLSRPMYLHDEALGDPDSALELADKEQQRLLGVSIALLDTVRSETAADTPLDRATLERAGRDLGAAVDTFLGDLLDRQLSAELATRVLMLDRRQDHLQALHDTTAQLAAAMATAQLDGRPAALLEGIKESLSLILLSAEDAWRSRQRDDAELLLQLSADRGDLMERLRQRIAGAGSAHAETSTLFYVTSLFERAVWLVRQIAVPLARGDGRERVAAVAPAPREQPAAETRG